MGPELTMLFMLMGMIIGLSHLSDENMARMKRQLDGQRFTQSTFKLFALGANARSAFVFLISGGRHEG
jgi:hypothetical protein